MLFSIPPELAATEKLPVLVSKELLPAKDTVRDFDTAPPNRIEANTTYSGTTQTRCAEGKILISCGNSLRRCVSRADPYHIRLRVSQKEKTTNKQRIFEEHGTSF